MQQSDIASLRLSNQKLLSSKLAGPAEVVSHLGAVQAQDYPAAKWSVGLRTKNSNDADVEEVYNQGLILRTHVMRPTWHFVMPEDIRWMQELTAKRVKAVMASYNRKLELNEEVFSLSNKTILKALDGGVFLTRQELKHELAEVGIKTDVQRLAHLVMNAELDCLICSGPRRGKQFTYALIEGRVPKVKRINRDESLARLALRYFNSHGPAQIKDFSWWSGLSIKEAAEGLDMVESKLKKETVEGKTYWFSEGFNFKLQTKPLDNTQDESHRAYLLSIYDEYIIAYKDRGALGGERYVEKMIAMGNALTAVIILDGKIAGTWKRQMKKDSVEILLNLFITLNKAEREAIEKACEVYGNFFGVRAILAGL